MLTKDAYLQERPYIVMGTGHRPAGYVKYPDYEHSLEILVDSIESVITDNNITVELVISGGALGFDTALARYAIKNSIPLHLYIPFVGQEYNWSLQYQDSYQMLVKNAEKLHITTNRYPNDYKAAVACLHKRNSDMLSNTDICLTFHNPSMKKGGTVDAIKKAKSMSIYTLPVWDMYTIKAKEAHIDIKAINL